MATEYHVFLVTGDHLSGPHRKAAVAERQAEKFRKNCLCDGEDQECADDDMFPHGVKVSCSVDGYWSNDPQY